MPHPANIYKVIINHLFDKSEKIGKTHGEFSPVEQLMFEERKKKFRKANVPRTTALMQGSDLKADDY